MTYNETMEVEANQHVERFEKLTEKINWETVRKEQGIRLDMNLKRNLLIRYLNRQEVKPSEIVKAVGLVYPRHRQLVYDICNSPYSAYKRIEREFGLVPEEY